MDVHRKCVISVVLLLLVQVVTVWCGMRARLITDSSPLDNLIIRPLFHTFRNMTFRMVGQTSLVRKSGNFYQKPLTTFPCDTSFGRSAEPPTSIHKLRPGTFNSA